MGSGLTFDAETCPHLSFNRWIERWILGNIIQTLYLKWKHACSLFSDTDAVVFVTMFLSLRALMNSLYRIFPELANVSSYEIASFSHDLPNCICSNSKNLLQYKFVTKQN